MVFCFVSITQAQNQRINTQNTIGWYNYFGTFKINEKFGVHTEYQWRREALITNWQQGLLRVGLNYQLNPRVLFRLGYAWIETYPYGEIPLNSLGRDFTEHRMFQMVQFSHREGTLGISHRFMLEQRWVGRYSNPAELTEDEFPFTNRIRYMIRMQLPLKGTEIKPKTPYLAVYDELFIGFGKKVGPNVFDQNRIGVLFGYVFNDSFRLEGGYLNQLVQYNRLIDGRNVFQSNHGLIINGIFNFDFSK